MLLDDLKKKPPGFGSVTPPAAPSAAGTAMQPIGTPGAPTGFGQVTQPRASVSDIAADMMKSDSPLMRQAETRGTQAANRRGLLNSSIAVGEAQRAQLDAVVPMAQAEADLRDRTVDRDFRAGQAQIDRDFQGGQAERDRVQQTQLAEFDAGTRERLQKIDIAAKKYLAGMDMDADKRRMASQLISNSLSLRQNTIANINNNKDLSAEQRRSMIASAEQNLRQEMELYADLAGVDVSEFTAQLPPRPAPDAAPTAQRSTSQRQETAAERFQREIQTPDPWR